MNTSNESSSISIQDLEKWFDEELELHGNKDNSTSWEHAEIVTARVHILNKAKKKIQEQSQAELNSNPTAPLTRMAIESTL